MCEPGRSVTPAALLAHLRAELARARECAAVAPWREAQAAAVEVAIAEAALRAAEEMAEATAAPASARSVPTP